VQSAVLEGAWKGVWRRDTMELFNLQADPGERSSLVAREPAIATRLDSLRRLEDRRRVHPTPP
jgi:hypothetical protein